MQGQNLSKAYMYKVVQIHSTNHYVKNNKNKIEFLLTYELGNDNPLKEK